MPQSLRPLVITAAVLALAECATNGGCASKPPPQSTVATSATVPSTTVPSKPSAVSTELPASGDTQAGASAVGASAGCDACAGASPSMPGQTSDERRAALDKRLNESLGAFDAKLRGEQQKIAQERDARQAAVATIAASDSGVTHGASLGSDATNGDGTNSNNPGGGDSHSRHTETRSAHAGDLKSDKTGTGTAASAVGNGASANEIPDGNDDDIVARRLRKAAEQETDPELKDKLWKEYVEYKKNAPGQ